MYETEFQKTFAEQLAYLGLALTDQMNEDEHTEAELTAPVPSSKNPFHVLCRTAQNFLDAMERECPEVLDS